jgi:hypothetical protein
VASNFALDAVRTGVVVDGDQRPDAWNFYVYCRQNGLWPKLVAGLDPATQNAELRRYSPTYQVTAECSYPQQHPFSLGNRSGSRSAMLGRVTDDFGDRFDDTTYAQRAAGTGQAVQAGERGGALEVCRGSLLHERSIDCSFSC